MDPLTPVIVGAGQVTNRRERMVDALELMEEAARAAERDAGRPVLERVRSVQVLGIVSRRYSASATELATRLGIPPGERLTTTVGGSTPQWLVCQACDRISRGEIDGVLIVGAEALDSARRARREARAAPPPEAGTASDRLVGDQRSPVSEHEIKAGVVAPATVYPMFEQALAHRAGRTPDEQRSWLGHLMAPFTKVAASHPHLAWFPTARTPEDLAEVTQDNRMVAEPYTKRLNAVLQVDMGAALVLLSAEAAEAAGVPKERWVFPWAGATCDDVFITQARPDLTRSRGLEVAWRAASRAAGISLDDVAAFDLYSCFPSAVQMAAAALGLDLDDPRGLTVTGGLPFFGGPGNNYMTHAIGLMAWRLREGEGTIGVTTGVSWYMSKHAVGIYSSRPPSGGWRHPSTTDAQARIDATAIPLAAAPEGEAVVEAFTIEWDRERGPVRAPIYATTRDGRRAVAVPADAELPAHISGTSIVGRTVRLRAGEGGTVYEL